MEAHSPQVARYSWTQPQCLDCWYAAHPEGRKPVRLVSERRQETCVTCGRETINGIFIRIDPAKAPHPTRLKD